MNILVVSGTPWNDNNSFGNTYSDIFSEFTDARFANICCKSGDLFSPLNLCGYQITEKSILKNLVNKSYPVGRPIKNTKTLKSDDEQPSKMYRFARISRWQVFFWLRNIIWRFNNWKCKELTEFIENFNPDIVFLPIYHAVHLNKIAQYIIKIAKVPVFGYVSDDVFSLKQFSISPFFWIDRLCARRHIKNTVKRCEILYVVSKTQKDDYEKAFGTKCKILTKSADFSNPPIFKSKYSTPLQLVYTGNIGNNRWKSLKIIADALNELNREKVVAQLKVYTATPITKAMNKALNQNKSSFLLGKVPVTDIPEIQKEADVLIHVEPLDLKNSLLVRHSFSTKLVDYFKASRPILAIGPKNVSSIAHLIDFNCAIVAQNKDELVSKLKEAIANRQMLDALVLNAHKCGKTVHDRQHSNNMLRTDLSLL